MLSRLIGRRARPAPAITHAVPDGQRVYAIGDIHGRLDLLDSLLAQIEADNAGRPRAAVTIVLLGDLVDRGPDSAGVVERLRDLASGETEFRFLLGNHEEVFLAAIDGDEKALRLFCRIGGRETALSYGISPDAYERADYAELAELLRRHVPQPHRDFLAAFENMVVIGDYAFVHAGVDPAVPLDQQRASDLRWIRRSFLDHGAALDRMIVHGHTISDEVDFAPHRIGIDTGAFTTGRLTAIGLERTEHWVMSTKL